MIGITRGARGYFFSRERKRTAAKPRQQGANTPGEHMLMPKNTKLCGDKTHPNREVLRGSKIEIPSKLSYFAIPIICGPKDFENNVHLPRLFGVIQPSRNLQLK